MADRKPDGWDKLPREGSAEGALVAYDPKKPGNFHVSSRGEIVWHDIPDGYHFVDGLLKPKDDAPAAPAAVTAAPKPPEE